MEDFKHSSGNCCHAHQTHFTFRFGVSGHSSAQNIFDIWAKLPVKSISSFIKKQCDAISWYEFSNHNSIMININLLKQEAAYETIAWFCRSESENQANGTPDSVCTSVKKVLIPR